MTEPRPPAATADDYEVRAAAVERLTFFADAVIAIAITLLALDLPIPAGNTNHQVLDSVAEHRDEYLAFLISFYVIGAHWRSHHSVFRYVTTLGGYLPRLTMSWLLMQVITPFATRVLTGPDAFQARFVFYASVQTLSSVFFLLMLGEVRRCDLTRPDTPPGMLRHAAFQTGLLGGAFLISIPVSFVTGWAYAWWAVIPFIGGVAARIARRRATATPAR
jgi:TMEM175 potassium channel family protein